MIEKNVDTITLDGTEQAVEFSQAYPFFFIDNRSDNSVYASFSPSFTEGAAGVFDIPAKSMQRIDINGGTVSKFYISGSGTVVVRASYIAFPPSFNRAAKGGDDSNTAKMYMNVPLYAEIIEV